MPSGSPCPATPNATPPTDNTSRIMRADCRSLLVNWAIIRFSQASRCRSRANYDARTLSGNREYNDKWMSEVPRAEVTCCAQSLPPVRANSEVIEIFRPLLFRIVRAALIHINIPAHVYLRSGAPWRHLPATCGPVDVLQSLGSVNDGIVALICPTCQMSISALDERRLLCMGILAGSTAEAPPCPSAASGTLLRRSGMMATARGLEPSLYLSSAFSIFTNPPCTYSFPHSTCPVFSGSSLPSMPEMVPPASRTMICPAAMSHGCKLRSQ